MFSRLGFVLSFLMFIVSCDASSDYAPPTSSPLQTDWVSGEFQFVTSVTNNDRAFHVASSESKGLFLLDNQYQTLSNIAFKAEYIDIAHLGPNTFVASLDINAGEIVVAQIDYGKSKLDVIHRLTSNNAQVEAFCLSSMDEQLMLFSVNALGQGEMRALIKNIDNTWQDQSITNFPVGPQVKSCAIDDATKRLFVAEESIGIWQYEMDFETEETRKLIQLPQDFGVEFIDSTSLGDLAIVSPDFAGFWLYQPEKDVLSQYEIKTVQEPKSIQISRTGNELAVHIFDDINQQVVKTTHTMMPSIMSTKAKNVTHLTAFAQTQPVNKHGDAADDPAIWIHATQPENSLVYATDKKYGLNVYSLKGDLVSTLPVGRINNIDIRYDMNYAGKKVDIAIASNRSNNSLSLFVINKLTGEPSHLQDFQTNLSDVYGLCLGRLDGEIHAFVNDTDGRFEQYALSHNDTQFSAQKVDEWMVPSQPEGCVVDDKTGRLFYGEESSGVWLKTLGAQKADVRIISLDEQLVADVEGMGLYEHENTLYLIVSSQGNNRFAVYDLDDAYRQLGTFDIQVNLNKRIDGVSETDGLAITHQALGTALPNGLLVVQDGHNVMPLAPQNFKLVDGNLVRQFIDANK